MQDKNKGWDFAAQQNIRADIKRRSKATNKANQVATRVYPLQETNELTSIAPRFDWRITGPVLKADLRGLRKK